MGEASLQPNNAEDAADALRESEARLKLVQAAGGIGSFDWDMRSGQIWRSPEYLDLHGLPAGSPTEGLYTEAWKARVHPDDREKVAQWFAEDLARGGAFEREYRIVRADDGRVRWLLNRGRVDIVDGKPVRLLSAQTDITERKQIEEALQAAERRQAFLLDLSDALRQLNDPADIVATTCEMLCDHLAVNRVTFTDIEGDEFIVRYNALRGARPNMVRAPISRFGGWLLEAYVRGERVAVEDVANDHRFTQRERDSLLAAGIGAFCGAMRIVGGQPVAGFGVHSLSVRRWTVGEIDAVREAAERVWDALDRARAEAALRINTERLSLAAAAAGFGSMEWDMRTGRIWRSPQYIALHGLPPQSPLDDAYTDAWRDRIHEDDREEVFTTLARAVAECTPFEKEYRTRRADTGEMRWILSRGRIVGDDEGKPVRMLLTQLDTTERRRAQEALDVISDRLRMALDVGRMGVWDWDAARDETSWDARQCEIYGVPTGFMKRGSFLNFVDPEDRAALEARIAGMLADRTVMETEFRIHRPDGEMRWVEVRCAPMLDSRGGVARVVGVTVDITARKHADAALRESEERYRRLFESMDQGFCLVEMQFDESGRAYDYRFIETNPVFETQTGLKDPVGRTAKELVPDLEDSWFEIYGAVAKTQTPARFEHSSEAMGRYFDVFAFPVESGGRPLVAILFSEISARRKAENELRQLNRHLENRVAAALAERRLLADIVEGTDAFVQVVDLEFRWLAINRAASDEFERIFGIRPRVGQSMLDVLAHKPEHQAAVRAVWARALAGESFTEIGEFGDPALDRRHYEMRYSVLRDAHGKRIGAYQFVYDVTERLREQARLDALEAELRQAQKMEAVGQLTGGVAHDFNNLLMAIGGGIQLLERSTDEARRARVLEGMSKAVERGAALTRQLLAFSRRRPLDPKPLHLGQHIAGMSELLDRSLRGDVQVRMELPSDLWPVELDAGELELALLNLCVNARDAMPEGGEISIRARNVKASDGSFVEVSVSDTGVGMSEEVVARVFEPFFTTKEVGKGSGLGLAQVYAFAHGSGGKVAITSAPGKGATVTMVFPRSRRRPQPAAAPGEMPARAHEADRGRVLMVEDDAQVALLMAETLESLGYSVVHQPSAEAALRVIAADPDIDLVFSDVMMPGGMSGVDLAREVRRREPGLPVILATGYIEAAREAEAEGVPVLVKPYQVETLTTLIDERVRRVRA